MIEGKLIWNGKSLQVQYKSKKGNDTTVNPKQDCLSLTIKQKLNNVQTRAELHGQVVEIELGTDGQPSGITLQDEETLQSPVQLNPDEFHNPYNFVPAWNRSDLKGDLGDRVPDGHHTYRTDRWSGRISVKLTVETPLLLPDAAESTPGQDSKHQILPLRMLDGKPYLATTGLKGMLRSAYEAVTNSRLSVFKGHEERLFYRMNAGDGLSLVPVRIENGQARLMMGTTPTFPRLQQNGRWVIDGDMYAAWLPRYNRDTGELAVGAIRYPSRNLPEHKDPVSVWLEEYRKVRNGNQVFKYWRVVKIASDGESIDDSPNPGRPRGSHEPTGEEMKKVKGYVCITNANAKNKHDERVFFYSTEATGQLLSIAPSVKKDWEQLIQNYGEIHEGEEPDCARDWSRHILNAEQESKLEDGTLCYAYLEQQNNRPVIRQLYPVMIARKLFPEAPINFLPDSLKPAKCLKELSPADRVFGWVSQDGAGNKSAYKGQLQICQVECKTNPHDAFQPFDPPLPLAILGTPKPQQAKFYLAKDKKGMAMTDNTAKVDGYKDIQTQGLRGRKVYPHHRGLPNGYWNNPLTDQTQVAQGQFHQEYRRPKKDGEEQRDSQNRSIKGWVNPGTEFMFTINVVNLSDVELGALLYLLKLPPEHFHRLGGGKPLGFGSVRLEINEQDCDLRQGDRWREFYASFSAIEYEAIDLATPIAAFQEAVTESYGVFKRVKFIKAFEKSARGCEGPVHYPRVTSMPEPDGKSYDWFVQNERLPNEQRLALPDLDSGLPLPTLPLR